MEIVSEQAQKTKRRDKFRRLCPAPPVQIFLCPTVPKSLKPNIPHQRPHHEPEQKSCPGVLPYYLLAVLVGSGGGSRWRWAGTLQAGLRLLQDLFVSFQNKDKKGQIKTNYWEGNRRLGGCCYTISFTTSSKIKAVNILFTKRESNSIQ